MPETEAWSECWTLTGLFFPVQKAAHPLDKFQAV